MLPLGACNKYKSLTEMGDKSQEENRESVDFGGILTEDVRAGFELMDDGEFVILRRWGERRAAWPHMVCTRQSVLAAVEREKKADALEQASAIDAGCG